MDKFLVFQIEEIRASKEYRLGKTLYFFLRILKNLLLKKKLDQCKDIRNKTVKNNMNVHKILPSNSKSECGKSGFSFAGLDNSKIKVRLIYADLSHLWNAYETLVRSFAKDSRFQTVVVTRFSAKNALKWELLGVPNARYISLEKYSVETDKPDIVILGYPQCITHVFERSFLDNIKSHSKMIFGVPSAIINFPFKISDRNYCYSTDYVVLNELLYQKVRKSNFDISHYASMGNPKFDILYAKLDKCRESTLKKGKLAQKTVVLWAPDHMPEDDAFSFDQYIGVVIRYFLSHRSMGLILRLHPHSMAEFIGHGIWTDADEEAFLEYFEKSENLVFDVSQDYGDAYAAADAIITDAECGVRLSAMTTKKPVAVLHRMGISSLRSFPEVDDCLYHIYNRSEMMDFLNAVEKKEDILAEKRELVFKKLIAPFDGQNGQRMKNWIVEKYEEKVKLSNDKVAHKKWR